MAAATAATHRTAKEACSPFLHLLTSAFGQKAEFFRCAHQLIGTWSWDSLGSSGTTAAAASFGVLAEKNSSQGKD